MEPSAAPRRKASSRRGSRYAVLGVLTVGPMSGYDIKKFVETSIAHFWRESFGNLYPLLARLAEEKLVRRRTERTRGKPDRHVYSLTAKGRAEFREWLGAPPTEEFVRSELLLKLFFGRHLPPGRIGEHLDGYRETQVRTLAALRAVREMIETEHADHPDFRYWRLTLRRGELVARARLRWAHEGLRDFPKPPETREEGT